MLSEFGEEVYAECADLWTWLDVCLFHLDTENVHMWLSSRFLGTREFLVCV